MSEIERKARELLAEEVGCDVEDLEAAFIQRDDALRAIARALEQPASAAGEVHPDDAAVDAFAAAMKEKLAAARAKGRGGWNGDEPGMQQRLSDMLRAHVEKGDPRDVANFCMFLHQRGESILSQQPSVAPVGVEASYHPCTHILIEGLKRLEGGTAVLAEWDRARAQADAAPPPSAVPEGMVLVSVKKLAAITHALDSTLGDTDPPFDQEATDDDIRDEEPVWWATKELYALLAAAPQQPADKARAAAYRDCCDTPAYCSSVRRCTAKDGKQPDAVAGLVEKWRREAGDQRIIAINGAEMPDARSHARSVMAALIYCADELAAALATQHQEPTT